MAKNHEQLAREILNNFINGVIPEYILDISRMVLDEGCVQKVSLNQSEGYWDVEASVDGDDFQIYTPRLTINLADESVNFLCNCPDSFSGICKHVGAASLKFLASLAGGQDEEATIPALRPFADWRQTFRSFFANEIEPEVGKHYLVLRFYPEPGRMQLAFFRARQNKSGLSSVHNEITLQQIIDNPEWCELSPGLAQVGKHIAGELGFAGHRIDVPTGLASWLFWSVRNEYYLFWKDSDHPCRIYNRPMHLKIRPQFENDELTFDVLMHTEGKPPLSITQDDVTFHGQLPLWVCRNKRIQPVHTPLSSQFAHTLISSPPVVPKDEIPEFLDRVWSKIPSSALYGEEEFLNQIKPMFVEARYNPKLFLDEEGSLLTLEIENIYETEFGEFALPGPSSEFQTGSINFEGKTFMLRRNQEEEAALMNMLLEMDFQPRTNRIWFLEPEEAITFLLDAYPQLVKQYRVFGEQSLTRYRVRVAQPVISAEVESNEKEKWFNFEVHVEYDGQSVSLDRLWEAWTSNKRYVQLKDGSYTSLPESWLKRISAKLEALGLDPAAPPRQQFQQFEAPVLDSLLEDIPEVTTDSFWDTLRMKLHSFDKIKQLDEPEGLHASLRGYQKQGLSYLNFLREYGFGGILADEMGLGKTVQTLSFLQYMKEQGETGPNLIVVPTSVLPNWEREAAKFVPSLRLLTIYGTNREGMFRQIADSDLVITTYALLRRDMEELEKYEFNCLILDEAQNIKNPNTITARSVRRIQSKMRLCLSGTPIENNLFELWSLFEFLMPGFLGSQHAFQRGVSKPIQDGDVDTLNYLRSRVKPFILRRTKAEVASDLPPKVETVQYCGLVDEQAELYAALAHKLRDQVLSDVEAKGIAKSQISILDALLKLRQICCHPRLLKLDMPGFSTSLPSGKFDAFKDMITDIVEEGHKVLVFSQFVQMLQIIRSWLNITEIPYCYLDGASKDRFDQVDRFNNSPDIPIFLISLKAGGTGINLTSADYVIHYDPWWNPAVESQATDRTHRIGQTKQVFSYKLICQNTVEEKILHLQNMKKGVADAIIPGQDTFKTLTREDLEMLFEV
ncbi:MAG: SNF2 helicase associated domain-containing protein [Desulfovibrionaceae bacterium]|nr:SNF2 helicase associated domain-containing protein [Desulfovibrionaceae bacterium]